MRNQTIAILAIILVALSFQAAYAAVGVGISPSKMVLELESGQTKTVDLLVFNTGDNSMEISMSVEGDIKQFTQITPEKLPVAPEPKPHALPIKNGQSFTITFTAPAGTAAGKYTGTIAAPGSPSTG